MNAATNLYFTAANYAHEVLPGVTSSQLEELRKLARYEPLDILKCKIDRWAGQSSHACSDRPLPEGLQPEPSHVPPRWTPCRHFGGSRVCPRCEREAAELDRAITEIQAIADGLGSVELTTIAGTMARAQTMWVQYHKFVHLRVRAELRPYSRGGHPYCQMSDVENAVWERVAKKIGSFRDRGLKRGPEAWLRVVVHSVVLDWFKTEFRQCRDARLTESLTEDQLVPSEAKKPSLDHDLPEVEAAKAAYDEAVGREWQRAGGGGNR